MGELLQIRKLLSAAAVSLVLVACTPDESSESGNGGYIPSETTEAPDLEEVLTEFEKKIQCYANYSEFTDCDFDGVSNFRDVIPGKDDLADDDRDGVLNNRDRYHLIDDKSIDSDADRTPDYLDTFHGDNYGDLDNDGWQNAIDPQPYVAPPANLPAPPLPPKTVTLDNLINANLARQMRRMYDLDQPEKYVREKDSDGDRITDDEDLRPTEWTNDRDGDHDPDWFDPEPSNGHIDSKNDPYDPRNNEYW